MTIAYWCVFIFFILAYLPVGISKILAGNFRLMNRDPRIFLENKSGTVKRLYNAHLNSLEMFPFFATAVIISQLVGKLSQYTIDALAVAFLVSRVVYVLAYAAHKPPIRSLVWLFGWAIVAAYFVVPYLKG
ncbi:MAG: MAPEG family protein [Neisseriaceae bacterium]